MDKYLDSFREMISLRGLTDHTLKNCCTYIWAYLDYLSNILHKAPEDVSWDKLRDYIRWLHKSRDLSDRTINCAISQLRFFTMYVLHKTWDDTQLPMRKFDEYLPYVPSKEETWQFISSMLDLKQRTMVTIMYSSGLRIGEVCRLRYEDVDRKNMRLHITHSKSRNDRYAILSKAALDLLTRYWFECGRPMGFLFPKQNGEDRPIDTFFLSRHIHEVFTLPHELNPLIYCNQNLLYGLLHRCCAETLLELSADKKWLGATPGIIQVLHTWNQQLDYHVHMHCIVSGGELTKESYHWKEFKNKLYDMDWCPYIKETFNGFGNAIEYLGRYTHKIAISNSRVLSVTETEVTFSARGIKPGDPKRQVTLDNTEFIRRYLMHVLPSGFQKIRYYGFLNNRMKHKNLKVIFKLQNGQRFKKRFFGMSMAELLKAVWKFDISLCPKCGKPAMKQLGRCYVHPS